MNPSQQATARRIEAHMGEPLYISGGDATGVVLVTEGDFVIEVGKDGQVENEYQLPGDEFCWVPTLSRAL